MKSLICAILAISLALCSIAASASETISLSVNSQEEADALYAQYAKQFNGADVRLFVEGDRGYFVPLLLRFSFRSLALKTSALVAGNGVSLSDMPGLTEVECPSYCIYEDFPDARVVTLDAQSTPAVKELNLASVINHAPKLETLTLRFTADEGWILGLNRGLAIPDTLSEINLTMDSVPGFPQTSALYYLIASLKSVNPAITLNGFPVAMYEGADETDEAALTAANDAFLCRQYMKVVSKKNALSGTPDFGKKLAILIYWADGKIETSFDALQTGEDFYGFPPENIASSIEEADSAVILYREIKQVGMYTNGLPANGVDTMVGVVNLKSGDVYAPYSAAYDPPAQKITVMGGGMGKLQPEAALDDIAKKLR